MNQLQQLPPLVQLFIRRIAIALVAVFAISAWGISYGYWFIDDAIANNLARTNLKLPKAQDGKPVNYLIIGSDSRGFVKTKSQAAQFGSKAQTGGQRSDTIMVAHLDPKSKSTLLVSFPRDLWVAIPGHGHAKLNAAFNYGPQVVIDTLTQNFDIPIHHYLEIDFQGFQGIVNAIGSVHLFFPTIAFDKETGLNVTAPGCVAFNGADALKYVRSRHYKYKRFPGDVWHEDPRSDLGRISRQQYFIRSLASAAIHNGVSNLGTAKSLIVHALKSLTADNALSADDLFSLADAFRNTDPGAIDMQTLPINPGRSNDGQDILNVRSSDASPLFARLRSLDVHSATKTSTQVSDQSSKITLRVLNGSGKAKAASKTLVALLRFGFKAGPTGNAARDVAQTEVRFPTGHRDLGATVVAYLGGVGTLREDDSLLSGEVEIVVGADFVGAVAPGTNATATAKPATTSAPANPGRTKGVVAPDPGAGRPLVGCG